MCNHSTSFVYVTFKKMSIKTLPWLCFPWAAGFVLTGAGLGVVDGDASVGVPVVMNGVVGVVPVVINGVVPPVLAVAPCTPCRSQ